MWRLENMTPEFFAWRGAEHIMEGPAFSAFGFNWCLRITSHLFDITEYKAVTMLSCHVRLLTEHAAVPLSLSLSLGDLTRHDGVTMLVTSAEDAEMMSYAYDGRVDISVKGFNDFLGFADLCSRRLVYCPGGVMTLTAVLYDHDPKRRSLELPVNVPPPGLATALGCLLASGRGADVAFVWPDGEQIAAHSVILSARSTVFSNMFGERWAKGLPPEAGAAEAPRPPVEMPPEITTHTLRRLLDFLYTDELTPESPEEAQHLLNAADVYDVPRLFAICESALSDALTVDNAATTLTLADQHGAKELKRVTLSWIAPTRVVAVMATEGWKHLETARPSLMRELLYTVAAGAPPPGTNAAGDADEDDKSDDAERKRRRQ